MACVNIKLYRKRGENKYINKHVKDCPEMKIRIRITVDFKNKLCVKYYKRYKRLLVETHSGSDWLARTPKISLFYSLSARCIVFKALRHSRLLSIGSDIYGYTNF